MFNLFYNIIFWHFFKNMDFTWFCFLVPKSPINGTTNNVFWRKHNLMLFLTMSAYELVYLLLGICCLVLCMSTYILLFWFNCGPFCWTNYAAEQQVLMMLTTEFNIVVKEKKWQVIFCVLLTVYPQFDRSMGTRKAIGYFVPMPCGHNRPSKLNSSKKLVTINL